MREIDGEGREEGEGGWDKGKQKQREVGISSEFRTIDNEGTEKLKREG